MSEENGDEKFKEWEHSVKPEYKAVLAIIIGGLGTVLLAWFLGVPLGSVMESISDTFLYHFIPFIFSISFFGILVYKSYVKDIKGLMFLATAVLLHGLAEFIFMLSNPTGTIFNRGDNFWATIGDLLFPMAVVLLYLHIELIEKQRPNIVHAVAILGTALPLILGEIAVIILTPIPAFETLVEEISKVVFVYLGIFSIIIIWISLFGFRIMYGTLVHSDSPDIARASMFVLVGFASLMTNLALMGASYSSSIRDNALIFGGSDFIVYNNWLLTLALLSMILAYILQPKFGYAVNFDVYQLLVLHADQGITLFSFVNEVRDSGELRHAALQSPAILAVANLVKEVASAEGHVVLIKFDHSRQIIFSQYHEIVSVLITQKNSYFLNKGLEGFTKLFYKQFKDNIVNFRGNVSRFESAIDLIRTELPFMRTS